MRRLAVLMVLVATVMPARNVAAEFEGVLLWRQIRIPRARLVAWAPGLRDEPEKVFAIPPEQLLSLKAAWVEVRESAVQIRGGKARLDAALGDDQAGYFVIDSDAGTAFLVSTTKGKVVEITQGETQAIRDRLADVEKMAEKRLPEIGAKENARLKKVLKGLSGVKKGSLRRLAKGREVNGQQATGYELRLADVVMQGWVTPEPADLVPTFRSLQKARNKLGPFGGDHKDAMGLFAERGLPVLVQALGPERYQVDQLVRIERRPVAASSFELPAGLARTSLEQMMKDALRAVREAEPAATP